MSSTQPNPIETPKISFNSPWTWTAIYRDGKTVTSADVKGPANIDRNQIIELQLSFNGEVRHAIEFQPEMRLILLYRTLADDAGNSYCMVIAGWQSTVNGVNVKTVFELHPNGVSLIRNYDRGSREQ